MRERASLLGGALTAGTTTDGGFAVTAGTTTDGGFAVTAVLPFDAA